MNYKGIEIKDISGIPQIINPPRDMLVWDDEISDLEEPCIRKVLAIVDSKLRNGKVICESDNCMFVRYGHCAEIPKPRRATNREVSKWLAQGNGEVTEGETVGSPYCKSSLYYDSGNSNKPCRDAVQIRKWDDENWHEPTIDYIGIEEVG